METLKVTPNYDNNTFKIEQYFEGKLSTTYNTSSFSNEEFEECLYNTEKDWKDFLNKSNFYSVVN